MKKLTDIKDPGEYAVVDMTTGTVLAVEGLVLIPWPRNEETAEEITSNDSDAADYAHHHGKPLYYNEGDV